MCNQAPESRGNIWNYLDFCSSSVQTVDNYRHVVFVTFYRTTCRTFTGKRLTCWGQQSRFPGSGPRERWPPWPRLLVPKPTGWPRTAAPCSWASETQVPLPVLIVRLKVREEKVMCFSLQFRYFRYKLQFTILTVFYMFWLYCRHIIEWFYECDWDCCILFGLQVKSCSWGQNTN